MKVDDQALTSNYNYSDFLDEIFRCMKNIKICLEKKDIFAKNWLIYEISDNTFEIWVERCFITKQLPFIEIIELCGKLYAGTYSIPFSFISTQIIRLFYFPTQNCINFLKIILMLKNSLKGAKRVPFIECQEGYQRKDH